MIEEALRKLSKKHLLILGGTPDQRKDLVGQIISGANRDFFRFPKGMKTIDEYVDFVRKEGLFRPWYEKKGRYGTNQILDFHRDWIAENNALIILEDLDEMEERWKLDLLKTYFREIQNRQKGEKKIGLVITQEEEGGLIQKLADQVYISENDRRNSTQIINGSVEVMTF